MTSSISLIKSDLFGNNKDYQLSPRQVQRIIDLGWRMKLILMQPDALKLTQEIMKIVRKMNISTFIYKQRTMKFIQKFKTSSLLALFQQTQTPGKLRQKSSQKQLKFDNLQMCRQKLIQAIVQQLSNARQDLTKIEQLDPNLNISNTQDAPLDEDSQSFNSKKYQSTEVQQLKKVIFNMQSQYKNYKKTIQQLSRQCSEKDEKINTMKSKILKLNQFIMKQAKSQTQYEQKTTQSFNNSQAQIQNVRLKSQTENTSQNSQALQKQVVQLKRQVQHLKQSLSQSMEASIRKSRSNQIEKEKQFLALSRQYAVVRQQVSYIINQKKRSGDNQQQQISVEEQNWNDFNEENVFALRAELDIFKQKYSVLQKSYSNLRQQYEKTLQRNQQLSKPSFEITLSQNHNYLNPKQSIQNLRQRKKSKNFTPKGERSSILNKKVEVGSDEEQQIIRQIKQIDKMQRMSEVIGITSFETLINPTQMSTKIQGFDYNNSVIYKVKSSKFIQSFEAKMSLVLQYTCLLQLYFSKSFRSSVRQQLMMEQTIVLRPISPSDLNQALFLDTSQIQQGSFSAMSSSKASTYNRMSGPYSQLFMSQISKSNNTKSYKQQKNMQIINNGLTTSMKDVVNIQKQSKQKQLTRKKLEQIEIQFKQLTNLIPNDFLNPHQLRQDHQFMQKVIKLRNNSIAQIISNLLKQNQVFKKCLNQMIRNEQNFTKINNEIYFDEDGQLRRRSNSSGNTKPENHRNHNVNKPIFEDPSKNKDKDKDKDNCMIM